jgi:hypothetical protein
MQRLLILSTNKIPYVVIIISLECSHCEQLLYTYFYSFYNKIDYVLFLHNILSYFCLFFVVFEKVKVGIYHLYLYEKKITITAKIQRKKKQPTSGRLLLLKKKMSNISKTT